MLRWGFCFLYFLNLSCHREAKLPQLGRFEVSKLDTTYLPILPFSFLNQDSLIYSSSDTKGKVYVADFIFLNCPTICPIMTNHMMELYLKYKNHADVLFLSHTIDPENDRPSVLKSYVISLGIDTKKWNFVTGEQQEIYDLAKESYFTMAQSDTLAPGGYIHGGGLFLVDKNGIIRGVYDGTSSKENQRLINDLDKLLKED